MKRQRFENQRAARRGVPPLVGVHAIEAWLDVGGKRIQTLHYDPLVARRIAPLLDKAQQANIELVAQSRQELSELATTPHHQGVVASGAPFVYAPLESVLNTAADPALVVVADHFQDPQNLGALLRSAESAGAAAVILPEDRAAPVTAAVEMAAAGASAFLPVIRVVNLVRALDVLKQHGYWSAALVPRSGKDLFEFEAPRRLVLVIGGEVGVHALVQRRADFLLSIPMWGRSESLNASVAAAIALFEVRRRWRKP